MLRLYGLLYMLLAVKGSTIECEKRMDVVSKDSEQWPILQAFRDEQVAKGHLLSVSYMYGFSYNQAILHAEDNTTYMYPDPAYEYKYGGRIIREILELNGRAVIDIQMGWDFTVILTEDRFAWTAGENASGQLSRDTIKRPIFTKVQDVPKVKQIAVGDYFVVVLTYDGRLFSWGLGDYGRLGYSAGSTNPTPRSISGITSPTFVCCSYSACMALTENAEVLTWGHSSYIGRSGLYSQPEPLSGIPSQETIIKMSCGQWYMLALSSSGRLYGWGSNDYGTLLQAPSYKEYVTELDLGGKIVRDVVAGHYLTIVRTDTDDVYYFGYYKGASNTTPRLASGNHPPRDLMARGPRGQGTRGAVQLGCKANPV